MRRTRVAILISGRGSNMAALMAAAKDPAYPAQVVGVISDTADAKGLETAERGGVAARAVVPAAGQDRAAHEAALQSVLTDLDAELVCLAGYMRRLSPEFTRRWEGRLINIHPSLLPLYRGLDTHRRALADGVRLHGCSVHFVSAEIDAGAIIAQAAVPVLPEDGEAELAARVLAAEHKLYPLALKLVATGRATLKNGRVAFDHVAASGTLFSPATAETASDIESLARMTP